MLKKFSVFSTFVGLSLLSIFLPSKPSFAFAGLGTNAGVNLLELTSNSTNNNPNSDFVTSLSSSASAAGSEGRSNVSLIPLTVSTFASSSDSLTIHDGIAGGGFNIDYTLDGTNGLNGKSIPLDFNFNLTGAIEASSIPGDRSSIGIASYLYDIGLSGDKEIHTGFASVVSVAGIPATVSSLGTPLRAKITPTFKIKDSDPFKFDPDELKSAAPLALSIQALSELMTEPQDPLTFDADLATGLALQALSAFINLVPQNKRSLPDSLGGGTIDVGFDVAFTIDELIPIRTDVEEGGFIILSATSSAGSSSGASGTSNFANTLKLKSISLADGFNTTGLENLSVLFDSGQRVKVDIPIVLETDPGTNSGVSPETNPEAEKVPEPSSTLALLAILFLVGVETRRKSKQLIRR